MQKWECEEPGPVLPFARVVSKSSQIECIHFVDPEYSPDENQEQHRGPNCVKQAVLVKNGWIPTRHKVVFGHAHFLKIRKFISMHSTEAIGKVIFERRIAGSSATRFGTQGAEITPPMSRLI